MNAAQETVARRTLEGSETDTMSFPEGVGMLMAAGFDGYAVDFRLGSRTYYLPDGEALALDARKTAARMDVSFDAAAVRAAIREAQAMVPGYSYNGFCEKAAAAGCAGYIVSLPGRRVLYYGRNGETHTEYFPGTQP